MHTPTLSTTRPARPHSEPSKRSNRPSVKAAASVFIPDAMIEATLGAPRRPGPDLGAMLARRALYCLTESARTGHAFVFASCDAIATAFATREPLGVLDSEMKRSGMGRSTLEKHRAAFLARVADVAPGGRYRVRRGTGPTPRFYAMDPQVADDLLYRCSNRTLRALLLALRSLSAAAAADQTQVLAITRACIRRSGQSLAGFCRAIREARILGLVDDNRPGDKLDPATIAEGETPRYPPRVIYLTSKVVPLSKGQIVSRPTKTVPGKTGSPANGGQPPLSNPHNGTRSDLSLVLPSVEQVESYPSTTAQQDSAELAEAARHVETGTPPMGTVDPTPQAASVTRRVDSTRLRQGTHRAPDFAAVRAILIEADVPGGSTATDRACEAIADALGTVGELRRLLAGGKLGLDKADRPVNYLAQVCRDEGPAMLARQWPGSFLYQFATARQTTPAAIDQAAKRAAYLASPEGQQAERQKAAVEYVRRVKLAHPYDTNAQRAAAAALRETGLDEAAEAVIHGANAQDDHDRYAALRPAWEWPEFKSAAYAALGAQSAIEWTKALAIKWRGIGDAVLVCPDHTHGKLLAELPALRLDRLATVAADARALPSSDSYSLAKFAQSLHGPNTMLVTLAQQLADDTGHSWTIEIQAPDGTRCARITAHPETPDYAQSRPVQHRPPDSAASAGTATARGERASPRHDGRAGSDQRAEPQGRGGRDDGRGGAADVLAPPPRNRRGNGSGRAAGARDGNGLLAAQDPDRREPLDPTPTGEPDHASSTAHPARDDDRRQDHRAELDRAEPELDELDRLSGGHRLSIQPQHGPIQPHRGPERLGNEPSIGPRNDARRWLAEAAAKGSSTAASVLAALIRKSKPH